MSCSISYMYDLDSIILKHSDAHVYQLTKNIFLPGYFLQNLFYYIFSVGVHQNLVIGQKQFARQRVKIDGYLLNLLSRDF